jgi:hypothetical protein
MDMLISLVQLVIWLVVIAIVFGVLIWAVRSIFPQAPPIVHTGLVVLAVLIGLYIVLVALGSSVGSPRLFAPR